MKIINWLDKHNGSVIAILTLLLVVFNGLNFYIIKEEIKEKNRPYIGVKNNGAEKLLNEQVVQGLLDLSLLASVSINNYGNLPAYYEVDYNGMSQYIVSYQINKGFIMPQQFLDFKWIDAFPEKIESDFCSLYKNRSIIIKYGKDPNNLDYTTVLYPEMINSPAESKELDSLPSADCWEGDYLRILQKKVGVWGIERIK